MQYEVATVPSHLPSRDDEDGGEEGEGDEGDAEDGEGTYCMHKQTA